MKKILFHTDTPLLGGAENQMYLVAANLDPEQYRVILSCRNKHITKNFKTIPGVSIKLINSSSKNNISNFFELRKIIKKTKPDLIHAHLWTPLSCKYIYPLAHINKIPLVVTEHDPFQMSKIKTMIKRYFNRCTNQIITISEANAKLLRKLYPRSSKKITTIHNGIDLKAATIKKSPVNIIRKNVFKCTPDSKVILSVGTLHERKGFKYLIEAFADISTKHKNAKLVLAGEGPERSNLEKSIKNLGIANKVILLGHRDDIPDLMRAADIFVLSSLAEAFGLVILEAMANKLPVIATKSGGVPEIIDDEYGILVKPKSKSQLTTALNKLLKDSKSLKQLGLKGQARAKQFTASKCAKLTSEVYDQLLYPNEQN